MRVIRKMAWAVPHPERGEYNHNIQVGEEGTVEGFADDTQSKILLSVELNLERGHSIGDEALLPSQCGPRR